MFDTLTERLTGVFDRLTGRGALSDKDVDAALREVRVALLEADVALSVVKDFIAKVREAAVGEAVIRSVTPGQQIIKVVYDQLAETLGGDGPPEGLRIAGEPPNVIMMAGLQGSGKTTTTGKLGLRLSKTERKKVLMASLDVRRPAAMEQLRVLGQAIAVDVLPIIDGQQPSDITRRALQSARLGGYDVLILDTAGRTTLDEQMMNEAAEVAAIANPGEILLVADALTGQDAVNLARNFDSRVGITGIVLIKVEPDVDYDWHENPVPQWIVPLSGRWFVETMDGHRVEMGPGELSFGGDQGCRRTEGRLGHRSGALDGQPAMLMLIQLERIPPEVAAAC
jgi:signal recognition particle subunit SRP54